MYVIKCRNGKRKEDRIYKGVLVDRSYVLKNIIAWKTEIVVLRDA